MENAMKSQEENDEYYEYCPNCNANLTLQKGYSPLLHFWECRGCGQMLINPEIDTDIVWVCDECGDVMNDQEGFSEDCGEWQCTKCGFVNKIDISEIYNTEDEFQAEKKNPYRGLSDSEVLELSMYHDEKNINDRDNVFLVTQRETNKRYIKKLLTTYNKTIYDYIFQNPIANMPRIHSLYESENCLIVIEEYIEGQSLEYILEDGPISKDQAIYITTQVCKVLDELHNQNIPIIHRDVKPSNIIIGNDDNVYLLDMNVAKWFNPEMIEDTRYLGTQYYAAPEQVGFGFSASSPKSDIYAVGMLLNVMLTGRFPKEKRAQGDVWEIIERCISLDVDDRYTAKELIGALGSIKRNQ